MIPLNIFKMGYVLVYKSTGSWLNRAIAATQLKAGFTEDESQFVHVEISGGESTSVNIAPPLTKVIDITTTHRGRYVKLLRYKAPDFETKRYKIAYFSASLCNKGYDVKGVLSFVFKWLRHSNRLMFCSEGCAWAYKMEYPRVFPMPTEQVMPAEFIKSKQFEVVWEGLI